VNGKVPAKSADCVWCERFRRAGSSPAKYDPCEHHVGSADYAGPELYHPSSWVQEVVGKKFRGPFNEGEFLCTGYDPRCGFWMQRLDEPEAHLRDLSERAIGRTYHQISEERLP